MTPDILTYLCQVSPVVERWLGFFLCNGFLCKAPFLVLGKCDPSRHFLCIGWLIFDDTCRDNQTSFHLIVLLVCILQN